MYFIEIRNKNQRQCDKGFGNPKGLTILTENKYYEKETSVDSITITPLNPVRGVLPRPVGFLVH